MKHGTSHNNLPDFSLSCTEALQLFSQEQSNRAANNLISGTGLDLVLILQLFDGDLRFCTIVTIWACNLRHVILLVLISSLLAYGEKSKYMNIYAQYGADGLLEHMLKGPKGWAWSPSNNSKSHFPVVCAVCWLGGQHPYHVWHIWDPRLIPHIHTWTYMLNKYYVG